MLRIELLVRERSVRRLAGLTGLLFLLRLYAASKVGFGDSEALYAVWAAHPQPAYLDHPGLIGLVARTIGQGAIPSPFAAHLVTSLVAGAVPWLVYAIARFVGDEKRAGVAALLVALVPEIAVGLFALTPDLLLAPLWLGAVGLTILGKRSGESAKGAAALVAAGLLAGVAASAKVSGFLLIGALIVVAGTSFWSLAGIAVGGVVVAPFMMYEARLGFPMFRHRFVETQTGAGVALRNIGSLLGGQLLYLSPLVLWLAIVVARDLVKHRKDDETARVLFWAFAVPIVPLTILCLWSPVAEPHWIAPALLVLPIHAARREIGKRVREAILTAGAFSILVHAWVLVPAFARLAPDPKTDITNELYGWADITDDIRTELMFGGTPFDPEGLETYVVGPHWVICAQLHAALKNVRVGCATPIPDDFDRWFPRDEWRRADNVLFVTDARFPGNGGEQLPFHVLESEKKIVLRRADRPVREFHLYRFTRRGGA